MGMAVTLSHAEQTPACVEVVFGSTFGLTCHPSVPKASIGPLKKGKK